MAFMVKVLNSNNVLPLLALTINRIYRLRAHIRRRGTFTVRHPRGLKPSTIPGRLYAFCGTTTMEIRRCDGLSPLLLLLLYVLTTDAWMDVGIDSLGGECGYHSRLGMQHEQQP